MSPLNLWVVDDDPHVRTLAEAILYDEGHEVDLFANAEVALEEIARGCAPDAILCDLHMPGCDGAEFLRRLRKLRPEGAPPVVLLSADQEAGSVRRALSAGARHFLPKPIRPGLLTAVLEQCAEAQTPTGVSVHSKAGAWSLGPLLGRGGMGAVYRCRHERGGPERALKLLETGDLDQRLRFRRELDLLADLEHPGLPRLLEAGRHGDVDYFVMELVEGRNLWEQVGQEGPLDWVAIARLGAEWAETLSYLHLRGVIHRDVKPGNLMIDAAGRARLIDLGIARRPHDMSLTKAYCFVGSPAFSPPELLAPGGALSAAADVYSLALSLVYALTGRLPFEDATGLSEVRQAIYAGGLPGAAELRAYGAPAELAELIRAGLALDPAERIDIDTLASSLRRLARSSENFRRQVARRPPAGAGADMPPTRRLARQSQAAEPVRTRTGFRVY